MASPATSREQRLRKTKAQLIDEIEMLEQHATAIEAGHGNGTPEGGNQRQGSADEPFNWEISIHTIR